MNFFIESPKNIYSYDLYYDLPTDCFRNFPTFLLQF